MLTDLLAAQPSDIKQALAALLPDQQRALMIELEPASRGMAWKGMAGRSWLGRTRRDKAMAGTAVG